MIKLTKGLFSCDNNLANVSKILVKSDSKKKKDDTSNPIKIQQRNAPSYNFHHQIQQLYLTVILDQAAKYPGIKDQMIKTIKHFRYNCCTKNCLLIKHP